jgi:predicted Zn-dependent peptidase
VETDVTAPAIGEILGELRGIRAGQPARSELDEARDYLVGVFPLRFDTSGQVAAALAGLVLHRLPDDELDRYRPAVAAVTAPQVLSAATSHIRPDDLAVVVVGDAARIEPGLRELGLQRISTITDPVLAGGAET